MKKILKILTYGRVCSHAAKQTSSFGARLIATFAAVLCCWMTTTTLTSCTNDNDNNTPQNQTDASTLVGTWIGDLTGKTPAIWSYGKAWNVWKFNADGTGVSDVFFTIGDEPAALQHQPFTYTVENGKLVAVMDDGPWGFNYQTTGGKLTMDYEGGRAITFDKADARQVSQFDEWSNRKLISVPGLQTRYTVFVYGNAGGDMDEIIEEGFWETLRPYLNDSTKVRVAVLYKYGQNTSGQLTDDGDVVWFELNSETDLDRLHEEGLNALDMHTEAIATKLYDPNTIQQFIEFSSLFCPAEEYIFAIWGHGRGFDPTNDIPGKFTEESDDTRGVIGDEWNNKEQLDMYELSQGIKATGRAPLKAIFFHNCLMGNIESLTELRDVAEYIACSTHVLSSGGELLAGFVKGLIEKDNVEDGFAYMLSDVTPAWQNSYKDDDDIVFNGDFKLLCTSELDGVLNVTRRLANRLIALYPTQQESIDLATKQVYRFAIDEDSEKSYSCPFFDLQDYADKLAANTGDAELTAIAADLRTAFGKAILQRADINWSVQHLDHYSLSVCLYNQADYNYDFIGNGEAFKSNICEGYEQSTFHKLTGWGNFLRINTCLPWGNPISGGGGPINTQ